LGEESAKIESLVSREAGAALAALLFVVMILALTAATMAPLLGKLFGDEAVQIEPAGYVRFMGPLGTILLFFTAVCPLLAYRRTGGRRFLGVIGLPGVVALGVLVAQLAAGEAIGFAVDAGGEVHWFAVVAFALGTFVVTAALSDIVRGIVARARSTKESLPVAARWFVLAGRRRAGSDLVHVGAALMLIGFGGASYQQSAQGMLRAAGRPGAPGASMDVGDHRLTYLGPKENATPEYDETQALVRVDRPDGDAYLATPSLRTYRTGAVRDTAEVAILAGVMEDVYVEVRQFPSAGAAFLRAHVNPLTWFVWVGSIVLFAGTLLGLWPGWRAAGRAVEIVPSLRRARSFGLVVALLAGVVAVWEGAAQAALVVGGAMLLAALWAGGLAVKAWAAPTVPAAKGGGRDGSSGGSEADRPPERLADEIAVEKLMGRWGEP
jgi:cytochrome c-type biogenesis protein CcmF